MSIRFPLPSRRPFATARLREADPRLDAWLRRSVYLGAALIVLLPIAREYNAWIGVTPLWLLGLPASAWWALHRFRLPRWLRGPQAMGDTQRVRRRRGAQALRRPSLASARLPRRLPHAA